MSMRVVEVREEIRTSVPRFMKAWGRVKADVPVHWNKAVTFGQMRDALSALDLETCSAADIAAIIGNGSWAELKCDECQMDVEELVRIGDEPDYDNRWQDLCRNCLSDALQMVDKDPHGGSDGDYELCCEICGKDVSHFRPQDIFRWDSPTDSRVFCSSSCITESTAPADVRRHEPQPQPRGGSDGY